MKKQFTNWRTKRSRSLLPLPTRERDTPPGMDPDTTHIRRSTLALLSETITAPAVELLHYNHFPCDAAEVTTLISGYLMRTNTEPSELEQIIKWGRNWRQDKQKLEMLVDRISKFVQWSMAYKSGLAQDEEGPMDTGRERASWLRAMREGVEEEERAPGPARGGGARNGGPAAAPAAARAPAAFSVERGGGEEPATHHGGGPGARAVQDGEQDLPARMDVDADLPAPRQPSAPRVDSPRQASGPVAGPSRQSDAGASTSAVHAPIPTPPRQASRARESPVAQRQSSAASASQNGNAHASTSNALAHLPSQQAPSPVRQPSRSRSLSPPPRNQSIARSNQGNSRASTSAAIIQAPAAADPKPVALERLAVPLTAHRVGDQGHTIFESCYIISDDDEIYLARGPGAHDELLLMIRGRGTTLVKADVSRRRSLTLR